MTREEIIQQVLLMDREQLLQLQQFLARLSDRKENPKAVTGQDLEETESEK